MNLGGLFALYVLSKMGEKHKHGAPHHAGPHHAPVWPRPHHPPPRAPAPAPEHHQAAPEHHQAAPEHHVPEHVAPVHAEHHAEVVHTPVHEAEHHAQHPQAHVIPEPVPAHASDDTEHDTSVADIQRILRGLGWRGHLTTMGPMQTTLQDGAFGPVTRDDWRQSATKRGLDPTIVRTGPTTATVNPETLAALQRAAAGAHVVGRVFIP